MRRVIRLTENDLSRLVRRVIKESEQDQQDQKMLSFFNRMMGSAGLRMIEPRMAENLNDKDALSIIEGKQLPVQDERDANRINEEGTEFITDLESTICNMAVPVTTGGSGVGTEDKKVKQDLSELSQGFSKIVDFYNTYPAVDRTYKDSINESIPASIVVLGITVSPAVLAVVGGLALILIFRRVFRRRNGMGCKGNESFDGMVRRINNGYRRMRH